MNQALKMKAVTISKYGDQSVLTYGNVELPKPKSGEILVRNRAVAVNPVDWKIRNGLGEMFGLRLPIVLGCEIAGTIDEVGSDVRDFHAGDPVYGYVSLQRNGGYAEYAIAKPDEIDPRKGPSVLYFPFRQMTPTEALRNPHGFYVQMRANSCP
jgi:NADPH:quinone reductase-like Zn-dependent oxidoreductase